MEIKTRQYKRKRILTMDKTHQVLMTNDGYVVSPSFCNPIFVRKDLNISQQAYAEDIKSSCMVGCY